MIKHAKIEAAIIELTDLKPIIEEKADKWMIALGSKSPLILEYRKHPKYTPGEHRYALLITMLESIVNLMQDPGKFEDWVNKNTGNDSKTNSPAEVS